MRYKHWSFVGISLAIFMLLRNISSPSSPSSPPTTRTLPFRMRTSHHTTSAKRIVFILCDQLRYDSVGFSGNKAVHTPNIDELAAAGHWFHNAYSSTPSCTPSRSAILTGQDPWHHGLLGYADIAHKYPLELPSLMSSLGWNTSLIGKAHFSPINNSHGFQTAQLYEGIMNVEDDYTRWLKAVAPSVNALATGLLFNDVRARPFALATHLHPTSWTGQNAVSFLETHSDATPFFLQVSFHRPHSPYDPPNEWLQMNNKEQVPKPIRASWSNVYSKNDTCSDWMSCSKGDYGMEIAIDARHAYYGLMSHVDHWIGEIVKMLKKRGWFNETLIIFASDHGDQLNDHFLWRKCYPLQSSVHIPLFMTWPSFINGSSSCREPVELRDLLPTIAEAAGVSDLSNRYHLRGRSLLGLVNERRAASTWRPWVDLEHAAIWETNDHWNALTDGKWKYIFYAGTGQEHLFDLVHDPHETNPLQSYPEHASTLVMWRKRLAAFLMERGAMWTDGKNPTVKQSTLFSPHYPGGK